MFIFYCIDYGFKSFDTVAWQKSMEFFIHFSNFLSCRFCSCMKKSELVQVLDLSLAEKGLCLLICVDAPISHDLEIKYEKL